MKYLMGKFFKIDMTKYIVTGLLLFTSLLAWAQKQVPEPSNVLVNDYANMLSRDEVARLDRKLTEYARATSTQIVIVTEESLEGEDPFDYTLRLVEEWGIGTAENDNGVLLYVAEQDRQLRIQTGYGAEVFLTDAMARRIIENIIKPAFRVGRYYDGLHEATNIIMDLGRGEYTGEEWEKQNSKGGIPLLLILLVLFFIIIFLSNLSSDDDDDDDGGYYRGGRYDMDRRRRRGGGWIFFPGGGWTTGGGGGFDGGGFGGGGFGGFGGGGFGGGGAGGSW